jgi:hypothetical protein
VSEAARDGDTVTEGARETLIVVLAERESVTSVVEVRDVLRLALTDRESVGSIDPLAVTLRLALTDRESVGSIDPLAVTLFETEVDAVSEAVKLGDTGDAVIEGVGVGVGMIAVYDMKNTEPEPRLIIWATIWAPPES